VSRLFVIGGRGNDPFLREVLPKVQLSRDFVACSDETKRNMNAWLLETFGSAPIAGPIDWVEP
jgi:hypothetical protein